MRLPLDQSTPARGGNAAPARVGRANRVVGALACAVLLACAFASTAAAADTDPTVAPITTVSADGRTGTDGVRTLAVSQARGLDGAGATIAVSGSGYDANKGVYVALCAIPPANHVPSPCGGGVDTEGTQGAAQWISSNPPGYGVGLAEPYGPGGSFQTSFTVRSEIAAGIDCRQIRCGIVTRNDHTRTTDRSQDIIVPVTFDAAPVVTVAPTVPGVTPTVPGGVTPTTPVPSTAPVVTIPPLANPTTTAPAPAATVSPDGRSVSDGTRTLGVAAAADLDPERQTVTVTGQGFDETRGIYVSVCAVTPGAAPGPCRTGSPEANRWVSSNPPAYGVGIATPFGAGGTFEVELAVAAEIDATTDCRAVACAIVTRADDTAADDRTLDLAVPVTFSAASTSVGTSTPPTTVAEDRAGDAEAASASSIVIDDTSSSAGPLVVAAVVVVLALVVAGGVIVGRRRASGAGSVPVATPATTDGPRAEPSR